MHNNKNNKRYLVDNNTSSASDLCLENTDFVGRTFSLAFPAEMFHAEPYKRISCFSSPHVAWK